MVRYPDKVRYSEKYADGDFEFRHVTLPKAIAKNMFSLTNCARLLEEPEWRGLGVCMSPGWRHYEIHRPEPHILLFRRRLTCDESKLGAAHAVDKDPDVGAIVPAKAGDDPMPCQLKWRLLQLTRIRPSAC